MAPRVHPTAIVEEGVDIGEGTSVWDSVHIRGPGTVIGRDCIIGEKTYVAYDVRIGDRVKVNAFVYICAGVTIEDGVMVSAGTVFTNDRYPRAITPDGELKRADDWECGTIEIEDGASIGAGAVVMTGIRIGAYAMVGAASIVTHDVKPQALMIGSPAFHAGWVCKCGRPLVKDLPCFTCGDSYEGVAQ